MLSCYVDDSGNDAKELAFFLAGWVGHVEEWERFSESWAAALAKGKPIKYFKHNEAMAAKGCFAGFKPSDVEEKINSLAQVILEHNIYGFESTVNHAVFKAAILDRVLLIKGRLHKYLKDPLYLCFHNMIALVIEAHLAAGCDEKIDFIFDGFNRTGSTTRCIAMYERVKAEIKEWGSPAYSLMGTAVTGDDKELLPLQAADLLAGQSRLSVIANTNSPVMELLTNSTPIFCRVLSYEQLASFTDNLNIDLATERLDDIRRSTFFAARVLGIAAGSRKDRQLK